MEGLTRTNVTQGPIWMTFTPLLGASEVVRRFLIEKSPLTRMETGKFKVFSSLLDWFEEFRLYHRRRQGREGRRRPSGGDALRRHDAALCRDDLSQAGEIPPPTIGGLFVDGRVMCHRPKPDPDPHGTKPKGVCYLE